MAKAKAKCASQRTIKEEMERETNWATSTRRGASLRNFDAPVPRNAYERIRVYADSAKDGRTEQHHARACDINTIMAKYQKTGVLDHISKYEPQYGDVTSADWQAAQNLVAGVKSEFEELPAYVRDFYNGSADAYLNAMTTDEGVEELRAIVHPAEAYEKDGSRDVEALNKSSELQPEPSKTDEKSETS